MWVRFLFNVYKFFSRFYLFNILKILFERFYTTYDVMRYCEICGMTDKDGELSSEWASRVARSRRRMTGHFPGD